MGQNSMKENFVEFTEEELQKAAQNLIAVSSIIDAVVAEYTTTGSLSVGAVIHAGNVVDLTIESLGLAEIALGHVLLPF